MSGSKTSLTRDQIDPVVLHARREACVILGAFGLFLIWSVTFCYLAGYHEPTGRPPAQVLGIPSWIFWGVLIPWLVADVFSLWFCFFFMADDPLSDAEDKGHTGTGETADCDTGKEGQHA